MRLYDQAMPTSKGHDDTAWTFRVRVAMDREDFPNREFSDLTAWLDATLNGRRWHTIISTMHPLIYSVYVPEDFIPTLLGFLAIEECVSRSKGGVP